MIEKRIGDIDRNKALDLLQRCYESGYLDLEEYQDRSDLILLAKVESDLISQIQDLPDLPSKEIQSYDPSEKFRMEPVWIVIIIAWLGIILTILIIHR